MGKGTPVGSTPIPPVMAVKRYIYIQEEIVRDVLFHLSWMTDTLDYQNRQTGIDAEDSKELTNAKKLLDEIKQLYCGPDVGLYSSS